MTEIDLNSPRVRQFIDTLAAIQRRIWLREAQQHASSDPGESIDRPTGNGGWRSLLSSSRPGAF